MSYIYRDKCGQYRYVYEVTAYRKNGKTRNKKLPIGRVDPESGLVIYKTEYLDRLRESGAPMPDDMLVQSCTDWRDIAAKGIDASSEYGADYLMGRLAERIGLLPVLRDVFPETWEQLFGLASFLVEAQDSALSNYQDWASRHAVPENAALSSQRISELLNGMNEDSCSRFYSEWMELLPPAEYTALDVTSISSYSELMDDVAWGYNRDHEQLAQLNLCMLFGEKSRLPLYQTAYNGSIPDVRQLLNALQQVAALVPGRLLRIVMDKGFYSEENVRGLLDIQL